jgi:hypothetical protein
MLIRYTLAAAALFLPAAIADTPDHVSSRLQVQVPKNLFQENGYDHREALFGSPPYGGSIAQNLYYADSDFCDSTAVDPTTGYPTRPKQEGSDKMEPWPSPFILMIDRGSCSFVQKVRNAQHAGAAGVIIADNLCLCGDRECLEAADTVVCQNTEPIMADDGSGGDITIPAFLIFRGDAMKIIDVLKEQDSIVQLEMSWALPHPDAKVGYELWSVPSEIVSRDFQMTWKDIATELGDQAYFTPHQFVYDGERTRCHGAGGQNLCYNLCTNNGRYCATDPDNDLEHGITGADVVREALRRLCVWKKYGKEDGIGRKYWDYINEFNTRCDSNGNRDDFFANQDCINDAYKHSKVDGKSIETCMDDSGGTTADSENIMLKAEINAANQAGVVVLPTMFVNSVALRGALLTPTIFHGICAGFLEGTEPKVCNGCSGCGDIALCVKTGLCTSGSSSGGGGSSSDGSVSKKTFGMILLLLCSVFGAAGYLHWKKTREDMRDQVRGILAEYMPLEAGDDQDHSPLDFARKGQGASLIS